MLKTSYNKSVPLKNSISMFFLIVYVLSSYIAQEGLLPPVINSLALYAFVGISFLYMCFNLNMLKLPNFTLWYLAVFILSLMSFLYGDHIVGGTLYVMFIALVLSFCFIIAVTDLKSIDILARTYIWSAVLMSFMLLVTDQLILDVEEGERLGTEISGNANSFSAMVMSAAIFAAWYMVYKCNWKTRFVYIAAFSFLLFVMGLSGGRKTMIAVMVCAVVFILFSSNEKKTPFVRNALICLIIILITYWAVINIPILYDSIGNRFESLFNSILGIEGEVDSVASDKVRARMIEIGLEGWTRAPLFGHGLDTFKYFNRETTGHFYYAHNNYVELLYDLGLVGFVLYYSFVVYLIKKLMKIPREYLSYKMLGLGLIVELFVYDLGGISFYQAFSICILAVVFAIIVIVDRKITKEKE